VELHTTDVAGIADLPPLTEISCDEYDAVYESDDSLDMGGAKGTDQISLKQTEFALSQFAKRIGQPNFSTFNKWKKVWVAGFLEKKHMFIGWGQNHLKQLREAPQHWETAVADVLVTFKNWLALEKFYNAKWIERQWVQIIGKQSASEVRNATKKARQWNMQLVTALGQQVAKRFRGNLPELPTTTFMVVIHWVLNGNNDQTSSMQLQVS